MKEVTVEFVTSINCRTKIMVNDNFSLNNPDYDYLHKGINQNLDSGKFETIDETNVIKGIFTDDADLNSEKENGLMLTNDEIINMVYFEELDSDVPDLSRFEDSMFIEV